jgi:dihydroorotate dehydrogenase
MIRPWLWLPVKVSHALSGIGVEAAARFCRTPSENSKWKTFHWKGLQFKNPLGIAGGLDKDAEHIEAWASLGAGFVEIGTVTPLPQKGNPGSVIDRNSKKQALWNKMGFPSKGSDYVFKNIQAFKKTAPLFINIGKNRETSLENAGDDYVYLAEKFRTVADALVVNISSPNTPGLRSLAHVSSLKNWLGRVIVTAGSTPVLLKLSPDMTELDFKDTVDIAVQEGISGFILTNTTVARTPDLPFPQEGGVSGLPLKEKSLHALEQIQTILGSHRSSMLIVSCGGVMTAEDVFDRLDKGADLVQTYSALVFNGPGFLKEVALKWKRRNQRKLD